MLSMGASQAFAEASETVPEELAVMRTTLIETKLASGVGTLGTDST